MKIKRRHVQVAPDGRWVNCLRRGIGLPYWSLSGWIKTNVAGGYRLLSQTAWYGSSVIVPLGFS